MPVGSNIVSQVTHPSLMEASRSHVIKFNEEYEEYKRRIDTINEDRQVRDKIHRATIRECISIDLLETLILTEEIKEVSTIDELTDEKVEEWYNYIIESQPPDLGNKVSEIIKQYQHIIDVHDPAAGVQRYVHRILSDLRHVAGKDFMRDKSQAKNVINKLTQGLKPNALKVMLLRDKSMWRDEDQGKISFFLKKAMELAVQWQRCMDAKNSASQDGNSSLRNQSNSKIYGQEKYRSNKNNIQDKRGHSNKKRRSINYDENGKWITPCLNPECEELHKIQDCSKTSESERKNMLRKHADKMRKNFENNGRNHSKRFKQANIATKESNSFFNINVMIGNINTEARDDTGADITVIPLDLVNKISTSDNNICRCILKEPIEIELALKGKQIPIVMLKEYIKSKITIKLPGSGLPILIRNAKLYITDYKMDTVLLGRDILDKVGFDFKKYLQKNYEEIKDIDCDVQNVEKKKVYSYRGVTYGDVEEDPIQHSYDLSEQFGDDKEDDISDVLACRVEDAIENGLSKEGSERLKNIIGKYISIFGIKLGSKPPAQIEPFKVQLKEGAKPFRAAQRRYGPAQTAFIESTIRNLESINAVYHNARAKWASPALAVPKPGTNQFRFAVDLKVVNSKTIKIQSSMPNLESELQRCAGSRRYANFDFCHGYWQIGLEKESREIMSILTSVGIFSPTRILQGGTDSGTYFQDQTREKFISEVPKMIQWLDDYLIYEEDEKRLLDNIEAFMRVCFKNNLRVHAKKSSFFLKEARFCGRVVSEEGIRFDPRNLKALLEMKDPSNAAHLQQFICATNWMRSAIPEYTKKVGPLQSLLDTVCSNLGKRTKRALSKVEINQKFGESERQAFDTLKKEIGNSTSLAFPKEGYTICLFTDASEFHWSGVLMQTPNESMDNPIEERPYEPLGFISGSFKGSSLNWSVPEKEGYAIVESMSRFDFKNLGRIVHIFTDHANLLSMYDPESYTNNLPRYAVNKLMRWALKLSAFNYVIEYIPGEINYWADMLSRWANRNELKIRADKCSLKTLVLAPMNPSLKEEYEWPKLNEILEVQPKTKPDKQYFKIDGLWKNNYGEIFIPNNQKRLQMRILIAAHAGVNGHRKKDITLANIRGTFYWSSRNEDVNNLVQSCIHCLTTETGDKVPRPFGQTLHATVPNEMIHFDFCYLGPSDGAESSVLIIKDDLTSFVWLEPVVNTDAYSTATILLKWFASFGVSKTWISDQGTHFLNEIIKEIQERCKSSHHFTLPYCPWSNGTVEVVCRELQRVTKSILNEFQLPRTMWKSLLPMVQGALNNTILKRLGDKCPITLFTGHMRDSPVTAIVTKVEEANVVKNIDEENLNSIIQLDNFIRP